MRKAENAAQILIASFGELAIQRGEADVECLGGFFFRVVVAYYDLFSIKWAIVSPPPCAMCFCDTLIAREV